MPFFTRVFRGKDATASKKAAKTPVAEDTGPAKPTWTDAWQRTEVAPEEVQDLLRGCTQELKSRALQTPFLLLPFRPSSDSTAARTFIRNYFNQSVERGSPLGGDALSQELRLSDPMVLCSVMKWCWSRLPGGVVTWEAYELFKVGEQDSQFARDAFSTFIPISVDSDARTKIIFDFFDLLTAIAAHGKSNGLGGRKLSRYAGWWAFEHTDMGNGFEAAYKNWMAAADATSHLFFAYLRSMSPEARGMGGISTLPIALQSLVQATEYPPEMPALLQVSTTRVVMIVDTVSPTPFALLRRAKNFEYRDSDRHLQEFANFEDPLRALTDECLRVLRSISSTNQSTESDPTKSDREASWSRFEDFGFGGAIESDLDDEAKGSASSREFGGGLRSAPQSGGGDLGRPTTPSWADFMSSGFSDENVFKSPVAPVLLPPDKVLPPIATVRGQSSQSHKRTLDTETSIDPGELASITTLDLDDSFWWVWISSLAIEESPLRKAVFGRCALLETVIKGAKWLVLEEQVKGAAPEPEPGAHIVEKKSFFGFSTRKRLGRRKSSAKKVSAVEDSYKRPDNQAPQSKTSIAPDQHARIQAAAAALQRKHREQESANGSQTNLANNRYSTKTNSVMTLQPGIVNEASQAMKWASNYDKNTYRKAYLSDDRAGTGAPSHSMKEALRESPDLPPSPTTSTRQAPPPLPKDSTPNSPVPRASKEVPEETSSTLNNSTSDPLAVESVPKKSMDSADDSGRKLKKKAGNTGFKGLFGTVKKKNTESEPRPPMKPTGAEKSAVASARAALESKAMASQQQTARSSPKGPSTLKKKPVPGTPTAESREASADVAATPQAPQSPQTPEKPEPQQHTQSSDQPHEVREPSHEVPSPPNANGYYGKSRREAEIDALSRVDTNERAAADREFSRFDQGPLMEQPAFVPQDSPVSADFPEKKSPPSAAPVAPVAPEAPAEPKANDVETSTPSQQNNPSYDRWAQIRKNAAERAQQAPEETHPHDADDSDDTSEEESFETRAARIKARVAELTGNMQAST
ncbi:hypothetical protein P170DRAFT_472594 [Aspergillus steynii IBT 23096]|uniref:Meiotically up-regulated protein Msb1/Mug8 domain-containing protein n=1 Tax=Aspergillus steynii IBT 23096 TaxID=1392250 RepID=A0A2I2GII8_9EURO|nr:uncharacterized protein P170DRAFT_472594 [Aspergillus steynii IBT 23096]PLB52702.1 hypothetical protein P170DRAFT_472594 [Aspergillus steynii IBT 23096]